MGHSSIQITVDTYGHLISGANRRAVDRLDDDVPAQRVATRGQPDDDAIDAALEDEEDFLEESGAVRSSVGTRLQTGSCRSTVFARVPEARSSRVTVGCGLP